MVIIRGMLMAHRRGASRPWGLSNLQRSKIVGGALRGMHTKWWADRLDYFVKAREGLPVGEGERFFFAIRGESKGSQSGSGRMR